mmetsp:Transcript_10981/g.15481  ORF Transcript_10981/g.15481 Transcript_10981/m.15481 type:complete len:103 (-) Transcript_10981:167-475(-)
MCSDVGECSRGCAFYSVVGFIFTGWVGIMLSSQPFFMTGIDDVDEAKSSAFGAMGMFLFTLIASLVGMFYDAQKKGEELDAEPAEGYQLNQDEMPAYGTTYE